MAEVEEIKIIESISVPDGIMQSTVDDIMEVTRNVSPLETYHGDYHVPRNNLMYNQGLIDPRSGERACNSAYMYACRDDEMLVVTKNRTKCVGGWQRQLCRLH